LLILVEKASFSKEFQCKFQSGEEANPPKHLKNSTKPKSGKKRKKKIISKLLKQNKLILTMKYTNRQSTIMMMIAFITIKSSLVPLIEGLCALIYFRFEISVVCSHLLLFFFVEEKIC